MKPDTYLGQVWLIAICLTWGTTISVSAEPRGALEMGQFSHSEDPQVPERFRFDEGMVVWNATPPREYTKFNTFQVTFPSPMRTGSATNDTVHCEYFLPKGDGPFPAVVMLHILGGDFELSRICCRMMASQGIASLFLKMPHYGPRREPGSRERMISADPDKTVACMTQAVQDIRRGADWLVSRHEVDRQRLGITGISLGGIVASLSAAAEPRFARGCFILAGGDFAHLVEMSAEMDDVREAWSGKSVTAEEVGRMLSPIDPVTYASRLRGRDVLMMNASHDEVIPRRSADALWEAAGEPERIWWNAGHYSAAVYLPSAIVRITEFFSAPSSSWIDEPQPTVP